MLRQANKQFKVMLPCFRNYGIVSLLDCLDFRAKEAAKGVVPASKEGEAWTSIFQHMLQSLRRRRISTRSLAGSTLVGQRYTGN